jgi:PIN domain nuclease of toxin-antitoxin system
VRLLLDTHYLFWITMDQPRLKTWERAVLMSESHTVYCSAASFWELSLKWSSFHQSGARKFVASPALILDIALDIDIIPIPITPEQGIAKLKSPLDHRDPFDLLLLLQAQEEDLQLFTRDKALQNHPLAFRFDA